MDLSGSCTYGSSTLVLYPEEDLKSGTVYTLWLSHFVMPILSTSTTESHAWLGTTRF